MVAAVAHLSVFEDGGVQFGAFSKKFGFVELHVDVMVDNLAVHIAQLLRFLVVAEAQKDAGCGLGGKLVSAVRLAHEKVALVAESHGLREVGLVVGKGLNG